MKRKISESNQIKLNYIKEMNQIDLEEISNKYGIRFTLKLIKSVTKKKRAKTKTAPLQYPKGVVVKDYKNEIRKAGFKLKKYFEDFFNEDNGEIVRERRFNIQYLN